MPSASASARDIARQIVVLAAVGYMIVAALVGTGLLGGTPIDEVQGGALDSDGSYLAPAGPAFSIWSVIYAGLIAYAVWQALPRQRESIRHRAMGWLVALTAVLNGTWLVMAQFASLAATVVTIVLLLAALGVAFHVSVVTRAPREGVADALLIDAVTGLHLGWVTVATVANIAAWLTRIAPEEWRSAAHVAGIVVLLAVCVIGLGTARASGWRVAPGLALGWGLSWLAVARLAGEPASTGIAVAALIVAAIVALVPLVVAGLRLLRPQGD